VSARATELLARLVAFPTVAGEPNDVVPVEGQSWSHDPFDLRVDGGRLYGRGASWSRCATSSPSSGPPAPTTGLSRYPGLADSPGAASAEVAALADESRGGSVDFGTEAGLYQAALDVPVVVCGPGDMAQGHVADEYLDADQLDRAERFVHRVAEALARPG
jgi:acetylornithine deacetylase